jgi:hypothetical protein
MKKNSGQSLIEVLIGLAIGALIIGAASMAIAFVLRAGSTTQTLTTATELSQDLMNKVKSFALSNWNGVYNLQHGSTSTYFLISSSSGFMAVPGEEGIIDGEIQNGLVGRWGFDEGTGTVTYDESGNGNNGTLVGGPVWESTSTCKISYCLGFNGLSTYVDVGTSTLFHFGADQPFTITLWFLKSGTGGTRPRLISKRTGNIWYEIYLNDPNSNYIQASVSYNYSSGIYTNIGQVPVNLNQWYFVAFVRDTTAGNVYLYVNGQLQASSTDATINYPVDDINAPLETSYTTGSILNGLEDDIRVYDRALTASEIDQLYNSNVFRRYFYVDNACRSISSTSTSPLASSTTCSAGYYSDPSTQKITAVTEWDAAGKTSNFSLSDFVTRWTNFVFDQSDWSGGTNPNGVFGVPSNQFASSVNVTATGTPFGAIQIQNLSQQ